MLRTACARQHVLYMRTLGIGADKVLARTAITTDALEDPGFSVSLEDCYRVLENTRRLSDDPRLGFQLGSGIGFSELGLIGYALTSATSLRQALSLWLEYVNSPLGFPLDSRLEMVEGASWAVSSAVGAGSAGVNRLSLEEYTAMGLSFGQFLLGRDVTLKLMEFSFPEPQYVQVYRDYFRCPLRFNALRTRMVVVDAPLDTPLRSANEEIRTLCLRHYGQLKKQFSRHGPVSTRLKNTLILMGTVPGLDAAAARLNMSPRSLRRHLREEGTSFQRVLDEFRQDLAIEYLKSGAVSTKEVAFLLGFSSEAIFRRAFKSWTGLTVGAYFR